MSPVIPERITDVGGAVGQAIGDAWHSGASLAHDLVEAAADAVPGHHPRRRSGWSVRRVLIAVGIAATLGLLVLAVRHGRQPWPEPDREQAADRQPAAPPPTDDRTAADAVVAAR